MNTSAHEIRNNKIILKETGAGAGAEAEATAAVNFCSFIGNTRMQTLKQTFENRMLNIKNRRKSNEKPKKKKRKEETAKK